MSVAGLSDTPGYYYAIAYWLSGMLFVSQLNSRMKGIKLWLTEAGFFLFILLYMTATDGIDSFFWIFAMAGCVLFILVFLKVCCDISWLKAGYYCVRAFITGEFAASLEWQLYYYAAVRMPKLSGMGYNLLFLVLTHAAVFGILYFIESKYQKESAELVITGREFGSAAIIGVIIFAVSNLSYVYKDTPFSSQFTGEIFIIRTMADLGGVAILLAYHTRLGELHTRFEVERLKNMLAMQYENYRISKKSIDLVNQKYHDLKHQIEVLKTENQSEKSLEYLERMEQDIKSYEAQNKTGNPVLDTILSGKSLHCQDHGINLTVVADGGALAFMDVMDISTLFGNALDNAIEGVGRIPEKEKRLIHLTVAKQKDFLRIRVENYYEGSLTFEGGLPVTTKKDREYHGYGLKSIQETVKKYGGSLAIKAEGNWFELRILIPVPEV